MEPKDPLLCSQHPTIGPYPKPFISSPHFLPYFPEVHSNVILPSTPRYSECSLPSKIEAMSVCSTVLQVCVETGSLAQCMNELLQLYLSDVQPRMQLASAQAVYLALDKCSDVVHITDQNLNVQVNLRLFLRRGDFLCSPTVHKFIPLPSIHLQHHETEYLLYFQNTSSRAVGQEISRFL